MQDSSVTKRMRDAGKFLVSVPVLIIGIATDDADEGKRPRRRNVAFALLVAGAAAPFTTILGGVLWSGGTLGDRLKVRASRLNLG